MDKIPLVLVNAVVLGLIGCGGGSSGDGGSTANSTEGEGATASAGSTASASAGQTTIGTTVGSTVGETAGNTDADSTDNSSADAGTAGTSAGDTTAGGTASETAGSTASAAAGLTTLGTTVGTTVGSTVGDTAGDTAGDTTTAGDAGTAGETAGSTDAATGSTGGDGTASETAGSTAGTTTDNDSGSQGDNPGSVPDPVLGEASSIDLSSVAGPAGYKIFSGDAIDPGLPTDFAEFVENSYINVEFPCNSEMGNIEVFPRAFMGLVVDEPYGGAFTWETADPEDEFGVVELEIATITYGAQANVGFIFDIDNIVNGSLIVGSSLFEDLLVTRIVQFELCN